MSTIQPTRPKPSLLPSRRPFKLIGELINNSFARAARAWRDRDLMAYQRLAVRQAQLGVDFLTLNIDGTQAMRVHPEEMFDFLPELIPAIQEVTNLPIAFDNPSVEFHRRALAVYDPARSGRPILNSVAASRDRLDAMLELVADYDTLVIGMASEKFVDGGGAQCLSASDVYGAAQRLVDLLREKSGRTNDQIILDPVSNDFSLLFDCGPANPAISPCNFNASTKGALPTLRVINREQAGGFLTISKPNNYGGTRPDNPARYVNDPKVTLFLNPNPR